MNILNQAKDVKAKAALAIKAGQAVNKDSYIITSLDDKTINVMGSVTNEAVYVAMMGATFLELSTRITQANPDITMSELLKQFNSYVLAQVRAKHGLPPEEETND